MNRIYSRWSSHIYPCSGNCGFIGSLDAFTFGQCYGPCPRCGAKRESRTGRFIYELVPNKFLPFIKHKKYIGVEFRNE